jgi:hypothetical protein
MGYFFKSNDKCQNPNDLPAAGRQINNKYKNLEIRAFKSQIANLKAQI